MSGHVDSDSVYAGNPAKKLMTLDEYFFLFRKDDNLSAFKEKMELMWNYNVSKKNIQTHKTRFKDYQDFLNYCLKEE